MKIKYNAKGMWVKVMAESQFTGALTPTWECVVLRKAFATQNEYEEKCKQMFRLMLTDYANDSNIFAE